MADWREDVVEANGLQLHYIRTGRGEQPALLLLLDPALGVADADEYSTEQRRQRMAEWRSETLARQQLSLADLERRCTAEHPAWSRADCHYWAESNLQVAPEAIPLFQARRPW